MVRKSLCCCMLALVVLLMISDVTARKKIETETTKGEPIGPSAFDKQSGKRILKVSRIAECLVLLISLFEK